MLRKAKVLAVSLGSKELENWVDQELGGYSDNYEGVPDYRRIPVQNYGSFFGPFVAAAGDRLRCAVLGKNALETRDESRMANSAGPRFKKDAPNIHVPVLFHMQWDDELFSRESQCELFDLIGSEDKRLISYPGPHGRAHPESIDQWCRFVEGHIKS